MKPASPQPIINCHTHIFTGDHVPPYIAKTFLPWPFYYLLSVTFIVRFFRWWYLNESSPYHWPRKTFYKWMARKVYQAKILVQRNLVLSALRLLLILALGVNAFFIFYLDVYVPLFRSYDFLDRFYRLLESGNIIFHFSIPWIRVVFLLAVLLFIPLVRKTVFFLLKRSRQLMGLLPSEETRAFMQRYLNLGRFAFYRYQGTIFTRLKNQYPEGTRFVILPMDMEFMDAGPLQQGFSYHDQMKELAELKARDSNKSIIFPFIFIDPRRIAGEPDFLAYDIKDHQVHLKESFVQQYIVVHQFSGFKIYPPLGYYVFDERLLPLWKYAADHQLPVLTHCIRGTIYYRGRKQRNWDYHPVFQQGERQMLLPQMVNKDFCNNFTHPLNYLCLLEERLLRIVVGQSSSAIKDLFGFQDENIPLRHNLRHLKICFGHFGGDDEWKRFFELDRDYYTSQLIKSEKGIDFIHNRDGEFSMPKLVQIWNEVDWYSIIYSLMLQFPNVYSDISYILHNPDILPLLNKTLSKETEKEDLERKDGPALRERVLFGTDFYVVRNHKSEKNLLADMLAALSEEDFDLIARKNPRTFLYNNLHGELSN
jgi:predicted TIM-barrel fold metal-dependent hydrolase